ncbi:hypothetical protein B0O99DRAFT_694310 [Bisporella sp. PMI_857]|nr:hypothetical protein B0O99DRAFT_694310 [Bisporella sp. PMI_857]
MSKICWFDGSDHHSAGAGEEEDSDLELDEIEHRISQLVEEKAKLEARLEARLDDAKWIITGRAPFVDAFQKYPEKKLLDSSHKRRNFDTTLGKICMWNDWCLRLDLTILCCILLGSKKVDEIFDKQKVLNQYFIKRYPKIVLPQWAAERAKRTLSKISKDNAVTKKLRQDLELHLPQTPTQTTKPTLGPPSSPSAATNRTTPGNPDSGPVDKGRNDFDTTPQDQEREAMVGKRVSGSIEGGRSGFDTIPQDQETEATLNRGSGSIEGGRNGFDTILQDQETEARRPQTDPSTASSQSLPPSNGFIFPPPSLHHTDSQRRNTSAQAMSNLAQVGHELAIDLNQYQGGRAWPPGQQFPVNQVQEPHQSLNPNQPHATAPAATTGSQLNSNTDPFRNFTQDDKGRATRREKRQKLNKLSSAGQVSSAPAWQRMTVGEQRQAHLHAQTIDVQASLYSGSVSTPLIAFQQDFNAVPNYMGTFEDWYLIR